MRKGEKMISHEGEDTYSGILNLLPPQVYGPVPVQKVICVVGGELGVPLYTHSPSPPPPLHFLGHGNEVCNMTRVQRTHDPMHLSTLYHKHAV